MRRTIGALVVAAFLAGCAATDVSPELGSPSASADPTAVATPSPIPSPTPSPTEEATSSPTPTPSASVAPRALFGTWRTTLAGQPLSLSITESRYRIVRGSNAANGSVAVSGDEIKFFDSDLCPASARYRWSISDAGALTFFPLETEQCPGRAEALLVRFEDYSAPSGS